jgi:hypothetical protein
VVLASVVNLAVWFSYFGRSVSLGFKGVLTELAAVAIALATARWAAMAAGMAVGQRGSAEVGAVPSDRPGGATADPSDRPGGAAAWGPGSTDPTTGFQAPHDSGRDTPPAGGGYQPPV